MTIKRFCSLLMAAAMGLTLIGCGGAPAESDSPAAFDAEENAPAELSANIGQSDADKEPESLPFFASLFHTKKKAVPPSAKTIPGEIAKAVYPTTAPFPNEADYVSANGAFDSEAYFKAYEKWTAVVSARPDLTAEEVAPLNAFFRDSARQFLNGKENRVYSPLNIYMALAMLSNLTAGNSQKQILKLLDAKSADALRAQANRIWNALYTDDGASTTLLGSSLWLNESVRFNADTLKKLSESFYASSYSGKMGSKEFDNALQTWLNEQTRGLLSQQASGVSMSPETLLALATTIYFKANWHDKFNEAATKTDTFHAADGDRKAPFMRQTFTGAYYQGKGFTAVYKYLRDSGMWLILPDKDKTPADLLANNAVMDFLAAPEKYVNISRADISLSLPKFDVSADLNLIAGLKALGITDVFNSAASNFSPMTTDAEKIVIGQAKHAARVKIDEEGCEAAAYTVMMAEATAMMEQPPKVNFTLDRPFLFAVTATENLPLFVGAVQTPIDA